MSALRRQMLQRMQLRGFALGTQRAYTNWIIRLAKFHHQSPDKLDDDHLQAFMLDLINNQRLSAATCKQAIHSIRFFYRDVIGREVSRFALPGLKAPSKIPELLSDREVFAIIGACKNAKYRTMMLVGYGTGIRLSEITHLLVSDIHSDRKVLRIECGKGSKDRYVLLNDSLLQLLRSYWHQYRPVGPLFYGLTETRRLAMVLCKRHSAAVCAAPVLINESVYMVFDMPLQHTASKPGCHSPSCNNCWDINRSALPCDMSIGYPGIRNSPAPRQTFSPGGFNHVTVHNDATRDGRCR